jgi:lipoprotein-anchoring transpeptidase ErfK/SrfK
MKIKHHIHRHVGTHHINTWEKFLLVFLIVFSGVFSMGYAVSAYPEIFKTEIAVLKTENVKPEEPVVISFSVPVFAKNYDSGIIINPAQDYELRWQNSGKELVILPSGFWQSGTRYEITFPPAKNIMLSSVPARTVSFSTPKYPEVISVIPGDGEPNVSLDIEDPIVVNLKNSASDFFLKFTLNSEEENVSVENNVKKTQFKLLPKDGTEYQTRYNLKIYARYAKNKQGEYKKIHESAFTTAPPPNIVWDKDYKIRLEQARKYTPARIKDGRYIDINLSAQVMSIFEGGKLLDSFMVSSGKRGMDTPKGTTQIYNKFPRAYSREYGLFMPYWMAIAPSGKYGLHELPEWPGGYKEGAAHLGIPVSHGCVRMGVGTAERVYNFAEVGTPVIIY